MYAVLKEKKSGKFEGRTAPHTQTGLFLEWRSPPRPAHIIITAQRARGLSSSFFPLVPSLLYYPAPSRSIYLSDDSFSYATHTSSSVLTSPSSALLSSPHRHLSLPSNVCHSSCAACHATTPSHATPCAIISHPTTRAVSSIHLRCGALPCRAVLCCRARVLLLSRPRRVVHSFSILLLLRRTSSTSRHVATSAAGVIGLFSF